MTFELSPQEPEAPRSSTPKSDGYGGAFLGFVIVLLVFGVIGFFVGHFTLSAFVQPIALFGLLASGLGFLFPLPIFRNSRLLALLAGVVFIVVGVPIAMATRTPLETQADDHRAQVKQEEKLGSYDDVEANPERYITVDYQSDAAGRISGTLTNSSPYAIANVKVRCDQYGSSRKRLDRDSLVITQVIPANGSGQFGPLFVDYMDQQATRMDCGPTDAEIVPGSR